MSSSQSLYLKYIVPTDALEAEPWKRWQYKSKNITHFLVEKLTYVTRCQVVEDVVYTFKCRQEMRSESMTPNDKNNNRLTTLTGMTGVGKSTELAHLGESIAYKQYVNESPLMVSLITFNCAMTSDEGDVFGLRFIFGMMRAMCVNEMSWLEFLNDFKVDYAKLSALEALISLRSIIGNDTKILICVDEIKLAKDPDNVMNQVGAVLSYDRNTDVVVSSLNPEYITSLLSNSNRGIDYIPIPPLDSGLIPEFNYQVNIFINDLNTKLQYNNLCVLREFNTRVIQEMHLMAAGHGRTLEHLVEKMKNGLLLKCITNNFLGVINRQKNIEPILLLRRIAAQGNVFTFCKLPQTDTERDVILGCVHHDAVCNYIFRDMLETNKCFIQRRVGEGLGDFHFMATTTLSCFFRMIQSIENKPLSDLGHLSRTAVTLFPTIGYAPTLPTVWERCRAMSLVSRAYFPTETFNTVAQVFCVRDISFGLLDLPQLPRKLEVRLDVTFSDLSSTEDCVIIPPDGQAGWDVAICTRNGYIHFEQVKIAMPSSFKSLPDHQMENLFAHSLEKTLQFYLDYLGIQPLSSTKQEERAAILEREQDVFNKFTFVLSIADRDMPKWTKTSVETMMDVLRQRLEKGIDSSVALRFVERHWDHVGYLDWDDLKTSMPPVLLPFAQLAHAALPQE